MTKTRLLTPLILATAILTPALVAGQPVAVSRLLEIAPPKVSESETLRYYYYEPTATSLGAAGFAVAWATDFTTFDPHDLDRFAPHVAGVRLNAKGRQAGRFVASTNVFSGGSVESPSLARLGSDRFVEAHCQPRDFGSDVWFRRFQADARVLDTEAVRLGDGPDFQVNCSTTVAANAEGRFAIAWVRTAYDEQGRAQSWSPVVQLFDASGTQVTPEIEVSPPVTGDGAGHQPAVGMDAAGNVAVVWYGVSDQSHGIWMQRFDRDGLPTAGPRRVADANGSVAIAMESGGGFVAAWTMDWRPEQKKLLSLRRFTAEGMPLGSAVEVYRSFGLSQPALARDRFGNTAVFWIDGRKAALVVFDVRLKRQGKLVFDSPVSSFLGYPVRGGVAFGDDGRILTVWLGPKKPGARGSVLGRIWQIR
jgi:hypothetical protein